MSAVCPIDIGRLAKICALFSSNHAGERAAAAYRADAIVRGAGLTWHDVFAPVPAPYNRIGAPPREITPGELLARYGDVLTAWERKFLTSLAQWRGKWTAKQTGTFTQIRDRVVGAAP